MLIFIGFSLHDHSTVFPPRFLTVHPLKASVTFIRLWKWQEPFMEMAALSVHRNG